MTVSSRLWDTILLLPMVVLLVIACWAQPGTLGIMMIPLVVLAGVLLGQVRQRVGSAGQTPMSAWLIGGWAWMAVCGFFAQSYNLGHPLTPIPWLVVIAITFVAVLPIGVVVMDTQRAVAGDDEAENAVQSRRRDDFHRRLVHCGAGGLSRGADSAQCIRLTA